MYLISRFPTKEYTSQKKTTMLLVAILKEMATEQTIQLCRILNYPCLIYILYIILTFCSFLKAMMIKVLFKYETKEERKKFSKT